MCSNLFYHWQEPTTDDPMTSEGRILIADDDDTVLKSTAELLRLRGYECHCAADASTASGLLSRHRYHVLICDLKMPGNLRLELVKHVQETARGTQVILITGYPSLESAIHSIEPPVSAYLIKPVKFDELLAKVQNCVARSHVLRSEHDARE